MVGGTPQSMQGHPWFGSLKPRPRPRLRLFCFPFAGGGAMVYRTWHQALPPEVEVCPLALPGRERRMREKGFTRMEPLVDALAQAMDPFLDDLPFAFFGHSMGAAISYELSHRLLRDGRPLPSRLFVSGRRASHLAGDERTDYLLPNDQFIERLREMQGTPEEVLANQELMALILPLLRADFELIDTHGPTTYGPLPCPITALGGVGDGEVEHHHLAAWEELTDADFDHHMLPGGHFFIQEPEPLARLLTVLSHQLRPYFA